MWTIRKIKGRMRVKRKVGFTDNEEEEDGRLLSGGKTKGMNERQNKVKQS